MNIYICIYGYKYIHIYMIYIYIYMNIIFVEFGNELWRPRLVDPTMRRVDHRVPLYFRLCTSSKK